MGKAKEESLPRSLEEAAGMPKPAPQVNRVVVLVTRGEPGLVAPLKVIP